MWLPRLKMPPRGRDGLHRQVEELAQPETQLEAATPDGPAGQSATE
jgi:hypothetical protein